VTELHKLIQLLDLIRAYEGYPQNKFRLQILPLQRCGHYGTHACRVSWFFWEARAPFADNRTAFTHRPVCLQCSRKSRNPPHVKCSLHIRFLNARNMKAADIHRQLCEVYGEHAMSDSMVRRWMRHFNEGCENVHDDPWSG
jgi:hypothetical protein